MPVGCNLKAKVWTKLPSHCPAGMNLGNHGTVARIVATIGVILSLPREEEKSQNPGHMKTKTRSLVLIPLLAYFSALPTSQAVNPPPDGGYPGFNTAEGQNALFSLTTGSANTVAGWFFTSKQPHRQPQHGHRRRDASFQHCRQQHGDWRRGTLE